jgi:hypothetical protein
MRVQVGQEWELPAAGGDDPLVLRIVQLVDDRYASVQTVRRSAPKAVLHRSTMHVRDVLDAGVLVAGPGALGAAKRRERVRHLRDLVIYAARQSDGASVDGHIRIDARELIGIVEHDERVSRDVARAMLREALATLGGTETWADARWWEDSRPREVYVIPVDAIEHAA